MGLFDGILYEATPTGLDWPEGNLLPQKPRKPDEVTDRRDRAALREAGRIILEALKDKPPGSVVRVPGFGKFYVSEFVHTSAHPNDLYKETVELSDHLHICRTVRFAPFKAAKSRKPYVKGS